MFTLAKLNGSAGRVVCLFAMLLCLGQPVVTQTLPDPDHEQLLNGLRIFLWPEPGSSRVVLKLRIHSGAAFDLSGRSGEMALLGDVLFPDPATIDYFTDEMGGHLEVNVNYDSTTITMEGKASEFDNIIEVLRNALISTQLSPEIVNRVRETRIKILRDTAVSPSVVANRAVAKRLFGDFPYGRPAAGTAEEVARVERADLMLARERFLNSNNATLAIRGGMTKARAIRTLRQLLGPWRKSEQVIPTTFRQPKSPDPRVLVISGPGQTAEVRLAVRGVSASDPDAQTADVLAKVAYYRWLDLAPSLSRQPAFVRSEAYVLPGMFLLGAGVEQNGVSDTIASAKRVLESLTASAPKAAELQRAKDELLADRAGAAKKESGMEPWLDRDTYRLPSVPDYTALVQAVSANQLQQLATRLFKDMSVATVVIGDPLQLKATLEGRIPYEVLGEVTTPATPVQSPKKPNAKSPQR